MTATPPWCGYAAGGAEVVGEDDLLETNVAGDSDVVALEADDVGELVRCANLPRMWPRVPERTDRWCR